jgi:hypothetical protein
VSSLHKEDDQAVLHLRGRVPWFDGYLWSLGFVMVRHGRLPSADGEFKRNLYLLPSMGLHINNTIATYQKAGTVKQLSEASLELSLVVIGKKKYRERLGREI